MKNFELLRYLKKWWFLIMVVTAAGCLLVYRFVSSNQQYTATAVIQYTNVNASEGLNADGTETELPFTAEDETAAFTLDFADGEIPARLIRLIPVGE